LALAACNVQIPADPNGTLDEVTNGTLRVGASVEPGLIRESGDELSGPLYRIIEEFSASLRAQTSWTVAGEETLVTMLEDGTIDIAVGGFTGATAWMDRAAVTRAYHGLPGMEGREIVMLVPAGENALLGSLEAFLDGKESQ